MGKSSYPMQMGDGETGSMYVQSKRGMLVRACSISIYIILWYVRVPRSVKSKEVCAPTTSYGLGQNMYETGMQG